MKYTLYKTSLSTGHIMILKENSVHGKKKMWLMVDIHKSKKF